MKHSQIRLTLVCLWSLTTTVHGQEAPHLRFSRLTTADGLSQNSVNAIVQDREGFMWFGTQNGLNRYDGYRFTHYRPDPDDPTSLGYDWVWSLAEDSTGTLWVGTADGLNRLDRSTDQFSRYFHDPDDISSLKGNNIGHLYVDQAGTLLVGTLDGGLSRFDGTTEHFTYLYGREYDYDRGTVNRSGGSSMVKAEDGTLWISFVRTGLNRTIPGGLVRFDPTTEQATYYAYNPDDSNALDNNDMNAVVLDTDGMLWIGTGGGGLLHFDPSSEQFTQYKHDPTDPGSLSNNNIQTLLFDDEGMLWIGTNGGGLNRFDRRSGTFTAYRHDPEDPTSLSSDAIMSLYQDRWGVLWIGTANDGLNHVDLNSTSLEHGLRGRHVNAVLEEQDGTLWIGTASEGLYRTDPSTGRMTRYTHNPNDPASLGNNDVRALVVDRDGTLWVGTNGGGLNRFDRSTERFTRYLQDPNNPESIGSDMVVSLHDGHDGNLWVGLFYSGVDRFDPSTGRFTHYRPEPDNPNSLSFSNAWSLYTDREGTIWVGTFDGLNRYEPNSDSFTRFQYDPETPGSISQDFILGIHQDRKGTLWVGTWGGGLNRYHPETETFSHLTVQNSNLADNTVLGILEDEQGGLWLSTKSGISHFQPETGIVNNLNIDDGLQDREFSRGAYFQNENGRMYFGGINGYNAFFPTDILGNPHPPNVVLTELRIFNEPVNPGSASPLSKRLSETEELTLAHDQNDLTLEYVGLHFRNPEQNRYQYILENYDMAWREVETRREATYTGLSPGDYVFRVKASNSDGIWNEEGALLRITILPPWWHTWWAYTIYGLLFLLGVIAADRFQRRRLLARERERVRERELEQARKLEKAYTQLEQTHTELEEAHQHLKTTQNQLIQAEKMASLGELTAGIAHEIKNPLNFINNFAEMVGELVDELEGEIDSDDGDSRTENTHHFKEILADLKLNAGFIAKHGKRADSIVSAMMQHASGGSGQREPTDVNTLLEEYVNLAYHGRRAQTEGFTCKIERDYDVAAGQIEMVPQDMGRVFLNLLSNAFDAVSKEDQPTVRVQTQRQDDAIAIRIQDNGPGIPINLRQKIYDPFFTTKPTGQGNTGLGLSLSYDIVTQGHGGTLTMESEEGEGATFMVSLPILPG